jgi:AcrR family transcriptional regulator
MAVEGTAARLVCAAREIVVAEGSSAVTMRRVAAAVGVTPMATYRHFPNREALLNEVATACSADLGGLWSKRSDLVDVEDRIAGLLEDFLDFALGRPHLYTFLMVERREHARRFPEDFVGGASPSFGRVTEAVEQGMREGVLRPGDALEVTLALTALGQGLITMYLGGRISLSEPDFRALCARSVEKVLDGIKA